nr:PREDICTED: vacuolar protein sorting-associated protein 13D isoform X1 [Tribolium castaneum]|eukprot:XP_015839049.1 PREDICTED: vacuolar protein sorting-associated protein 13D isoform X1 [Tribolium castaneum]
MLEGLAAWVLNNYLGKYVENLNTDQLSIALLSGKVELENLPLKKDALRHLGLPIEIKAGFIGKVKLQIPVRQIRSAPWVIAIEQLYLVASPLPVDEWDAESEELAAQEIKLSALDIIEARWRLETESRDSSSYYASSYSSWLGFGAGLVSDIIENLQLKIQDVHIRYEDSVSIPNKSVAFGVTMESLSAQSCDANWAPGFSHWAMGAESFKILEMQKFAIYWVDLEPSQLLSRLGLGDLAIAMSPTQTTKQTRHYILAPVSALAHVKRNRSEQPLRSSDTPRVVCDLILDEVPLTLIDWQYDQIVKCIKGLDTIDRLRSYRRYKPSCSVKDDPRAWWFYAISCLYPGKQPALCRPRPTLESCLTRAKQNVKYVNLYMKILATPNLVLTPDEKKLKDEVEWARDFDELKVLREIAMRSVPIPDRNSTNGNSAGRSMLVRWFPQWMGWYSSPATEPESSETAQLEGEILQVLSDSAENNTILKRDAVFGHFNFCLKRGCLTLCASQEDTNESSPMLELEFKNLSLNILSKPRTASHLVELSLGALYLKDKITLNTMFPVLMGPPGFERMNFGRSQGPSPRASVASRLEEANEHLFYLAYEKKPQNTGCDYRLCIRSKCLDVVYQPNAVRWLTEFLCLPHQRDITHSRIEAMKTRTKKELIKNWEQILDGRDVARTTWELELDISAPQIIFVEQFTDNNSAMAVIDFGRLQLSNHPTLPEITRPQFMTKESEDEEKFVTPCSTPPASEASDSEEHTLELLPNLEADMKGSFSEKLLYHRLYDTYCVELTDLQILIGKVKDNWRYAHNKGSSTLHVLDRFNISLQIEKRVIHTSDPHYPSLIINTNLPKLVAHLNESKITAARTLFHIITVTGLPSPFKSPENPVEVITDTGQDEDESASLDTSLEMSRLLMVQFTVDHLSLEVQSRGRCVAELQVAGVKVAFTKRPHDISVTLTVHSLLLVDALQTFGPDFELLIASHKHVGMDSMSGSLRDSEPTSPTSPASPDPTLGRTGATSPIALKQALSSLATSPPNNYGGPPRPPVIFDAEALISIEVLIVTGAEPVQIANIQFNNLDIIANQETLVELIGFTQRVFPKSQKASNLNLLSTVSSKVRETTASSESLLEESSKFGSTELTFDFHRLNVLLLRGVVRDGVLCGKKICTATMSDAKIQATVDHKVEVEGSLGGLQVLDLTPEGQMHQRIISVGRDPLMETMHPLYTMSVPHEDNRTAFSFKVVRSLQTDAQDVADVTVRMASLWYTHSPQFVMELQSCASEFKQYLSNLARSIRTAATDMALGLVHARAEALAQSLYMNARLSSSIYGSALSFSECSSPRKRRRSSSMDPSGYSSARDTVPQTPYSPDDDDNFFIDLRLDVELDSPVVVLPQASNSPKVFVAHLGKISVSNKYESDFEPNGHDFEYTEFRIEHYNVEIRDMNLFSVDTSNRRVPGPMISKPEVLYSCKSSAKPIIHDTILQLKIEREINKTLQTTHSSESNLLFDDDENTSHPFTENIYIKGSVVNDLKVSLTRTQYEQLLDTLQWLTSPPVMVDIQGVSRTNIKPANILSDISEEDTGVTTLNMDPHVRAKLFPAVQTTRLKPASHSNVSLRVLFELPVFTIELRGDSPTGEQGLVDLSFRDFIFNYEKCHLYETNIQVSLRSIFMEDLLQPENTKQRAMVISSSGNDVPQNSACVSRSCPDVSYLPHFNSPSHGSLPDHLETARVFGMRPVKIQEKVDVVCPSTPPPSPSQGRIRPERNLVLISTLLVDPSAPNFSTTYKSIQRTTSVDFNCLDLVVSVESWVVVIDFFSASPSNSSQNTSALSVSAPASDDSQNVKKENTETIITVRSLTLVLMRPEIEVAKANISNVDISVKTSGLFKEVRGKLGSMSLLDLTLHGQLYRERFITAGKRALQFSYIRDSGNKSLNYDAQLSIEMSSVMYVHTKRFVAELQAFFNHFTQLQAVMKSIRAATSGQTIRDDPLKLSLVLKAGSPMILLPVSSKSSDLLIVDLGQLLVTNSFKMSGDSGTISVVTNDAKKCLLDVMMIELDNMDLYAGVKENEFNPARKGAFKLGYGQVTKKGPSLLKEKFQFKLQVERNLTSSICHNVPDMSIYGQLSTLDGLLDLSQYRLIRGLLAFNLGEDTERVLPSVSPPPVNADPNIRDIWTLSSLKLDLQNVTLCLQTNPNTAPLTCINFIKSRLTVETFSNLSQDIDLISQEILIMDTRFNDVVAEKRPNVFQNILQPIKDSSKQENLVQAEIHSRKRQDHFKYTILLNNMRLMAIFDWWEAVQKYIFQEIENVSSSPEHQKVVTSKKIDDIPFELKLNITDSELVVLENTSQWDSNAVILKSTTVITYKPNNIEKPLSCSLNNCEMFSCILGMEDETALSIIDPVTLNMDINKDNILEAQLQFLTVRLSYHDMCMFLQMLNSLPRQMFANKEQDSPQDVIAKSQIARLTTLGFKTEDCMKALETCENNLDDAALWLIQNAASFHNNNESDRSPLNIKAVEVKANCISICIIDDCGDSDVPLLELSFSQLNLHQLLPEFDINDPIYPQGTLECVLAGDYYNRVLSGWEPAIEPWKCKISWEKSLTKDLKRNRLNLKAESSAIINLNITSTLVELYKQVKENWTKDYYSGNDQRDNSMSYRRRSPFVPFALKNDTGSPLHFTTLITEINKFKAVSDYHKNDSWVLVAPGETVPFSFQNRVKMRHHDSHKMKMHQLGVKVEGWQPLTPVTVDKVGIYFRITHAQIQNRSQTEVPSARIVFDISLEGSARKLITVRSALVIINKLPHSIDLKLESQLPHAAVTMWAASKVFSIESGAKLAVPVVHAHSLITARPAGFSYNYTYCSPALSWSQMPSYLDSVYEARICHSHKGHLYRFCAQMVKEAHSTERNIHLGQPAHRIILLPAVKLCNLLPIDLSYNLSGDKGRVSAGSNAAITNVDLDKTIELDVLLENFKTTNKVIIPLGTMDFKCRINLEDERGRKLFLSVVVSPNNGAKLKIAISAPYWIINKTGLPLVFRQAGTSHESAGQFDEHEIARMVSPLLFSFSDQEASPTINARVGNYVIRDGSPQWCSNFHVQKGIQVKKLHVTMRDGKPDTVFIVGVEVRPGRGKYRSVSIITISPRYQLYNQTSYKLIFTQSCFARNLTDSRSQKTCLKAMPNSHIPFHWPRLDKDQLLCVSIQDIADCCWSGGLRIDEINSLHVNVRDSNGRVYFIRLEVLLQGATFFIIFTDADTLPPPIRVDNFSEVTITFAQTSCKDLMHSTARAHTSVPYAWDQPTERQFLTVTVPGGVSDTYDLNKLGKASGLTYENFIYIAFTGTFKNGQDVLDPLDVESQELVLDVVKNQVILNRKRHGLRSQLWRMTPEGRLQHEGSSPPSHPHQPTRSDNILVLDIENTAPQPNTYSRLVLRRIDPRRRSTQTWRFTEEGRLCCAHSSMCVQAQDGFFGLRQGGRNAGSWQQWNSAVLGCPQPVCHKMTDSGIPIEQAISRQRLRPGSGLLSVSVTMDGPTRVLSIKDAKESRIYATPDEREWSSISLKQRPNLTIDENENKKDKRELQLTINLEGLGISLVCCKTPEELLYALFSNIVGETVITPSSKQFCISVGDVQVDNQLFETPVPVVLYVTPPSSRNNDEINNKLPAIDFTAELQEKLNMNAEIFKYLILRLKKITIILEEKLLLKLFDFIGYHSREEELINRDENDYEVQRLLLEVSAAHAKRYYFGVIQLILDQIRLSVKTATKLPPHLQKIKRKLGLTLIKFEDAAVDLQAFDRRHLFETSQFLINSIIKHFKDELMWQAGIILVSVDFLGNPLGFVNDVSEGFSGLLFEGNVGALVKNVTHGISNSAVKVTESISDGLGRAVLDDHHEEVRQKIRQVESGRSRDHIVAGFKGLGFGILGGATGLFKQVYEGASNDGLPGVISGIGKGLVGAVTKPVVGVLDFASETARAVRDSSRSKSVPERIRLPRCVCGPGSLLPRYSYKQSQGQLYLYMVNDKDYKEQLVAYEILGSASEDLHCIVSNLKFRIVASTHAPDLTPVIDCHLSDLESCDVIVEKEGSESRYYIEIVMHVAGTSAALVNPDPVKKPRVRCKTAELAKSVSQQINYAKRLYFERLYTLNSDNIINLED